MSSGKNFRIPLMQRPMPHPKHDYPITPRENLLRVFRHEKPMWMPGIFQSTQWPNCLVFEDMPPDMTKDGVDWFGTKYKYEAAQDGPTPVPGLFEEIDEWKEKMIYPDLSKIDWKGAAATFKRDESLALGFRLGNGNFERLHMSEGFEQALCDILIEQEACKEFFDRNGEYKVELFHYLNDAYHMDFACHNDDWATAKAQFFSNEVFENTLLDSAVALADAVHEAGCGYMLHCCGMMEAFLPYIVNDIKADLLEIQTINDMRMILDKYGAKTSPIFSPDPYTMYDPDTTVEEARAYAREIVDKYGAHTCEGSGAVVKVTGASPEVFYAFEDEIYHYSMEKYKNL